MKSDNITSTAIENWQEICRKWAEKGEDFQVHEIGAKHLAFCKMICDTLSYQCSYDSKKSDKAAIFTQASSDGEWI